MAAGNLNWMGHGATRAFAPLPADYVLARTLAAGTAETIAKPAGARYVLLSATADFFASFTGAAAVPGDVTDGTGAELNPEMRDVGDAAITEISVISEVPCKITASFWK